MKEYIVIQSNLDNSVRDEVTTWCTETFTDNPWRLFSDYRDDSDFSVKLYSSKDANFYMLKWGGTVIETDQFTHLFGVM